MSDYISTNIPAHWDCSDPVLEIAIANFKAAVDQSYDYDSLEDAIQSYAQNADDITREEGLATELWGQAGDAVWALYKHNTLGNECGDSPFSPHDLLESDTNNLIRKATWREARESARESAEGHIVVGGVRCYVEMRDAEVQRLREETARA